MLITPRARAWQSDKGFDEDRPFYSESDDSTSRSGSDSEGEGGGAKPAPKRAGMDPDHRLLLTSVKPLLLSRNSAVCHAHR
jgi:hypothetical protein